MPLGYTFDDFNRITCPALVTVGDSDEFCTPEEAVQCYRQLRNGQLAVVPATPHIITASKVEAYARFARMV